MSYCPQCAKYQREIEDLRGNLDLATAMVEREGNRNDALNAARRLHEQALEELGRLSLEVYGLKGGMQRIRTMVNAAEMRELAQLTLDAVEQIKND